MLTLLPIQSKFVNSSAQEVLLSLPPAGGSTTALLSAALTACETPNSMALIITKTAHDWYSLSNFFSGFGGQCHTNYREIKFPNGSKIKHGYITHDKDVMQYLSCEFSSVTIYLTLPTNLSIFV